MALKAAPDDQRLLLDLQQHDTRIRQLAHRARSLPEIATLAELTSQQDGLRRTLADRTGVVEDARAELRRVESDVETVAKRVARDTEKLAVSTSPKEAQALEQELESLQRRTSALEDQQLEVMERVEAAETELAGTQSQLAELAERAGAVAADRDAALTSIQGEQRNAAANRSTVAAKIPGDLLALYERQRERYGFGASLLQRGITSASGVRLTESDLDAVRRAAPDDVVICPDSNAILVRTDESGL
jgi:uncharacterized protein